MTEHGEVPEGWVTKPLNDLVDFLDSQRRPIKSADRTHMRGQYPYYGASGIIDWVNDYLFDEELILLGEDGENILSRNLPLAFRVSGKVWVNNHAHVFRPKRGIIDIRFLSELLEFQDYAELNSGTAQPKLNKASCKALQLMYPEDLKEQEAIAEALSDADALIEGLERLIAKKRLIKQGAMQDLLTAKRRLPGFSGGWAAKPLSWAISGLKAGVSVNSVPDADAVDGRPSVLKTSAISEGRLDLKERKPIADSDIARARSSLRAGTILISRMNTPALVGECGYVETDAPDVFLPDRIWMTEFYRDREVCGRWLAGVLSSDSMRSRLKEVATGTSGSMKNIAKSSLLSEVIYYPPFAEQQAIAEVFRDMDAEIQALETRLGKARQVKEGMMQNLLTGRIRLV